MTCRKTPLDRPTARSKVHAMRTKHPRSRDHMAYRCNDCDAWHVGRRTKR